jgi:hypothetical protein
VSNRVIKLSLLPYEEEHHQHAASVTYKDILGLHADQSNLALLKISDSLYLWLLSNCTLSCTRSGGVARGVIKHVTKRWLDIASAH